MQMFFHSFLTLNSKNHGGRVDVFFFCESDTEINLKAIAISKRNYIKHDTDIKIFQCFFIPK
jgi:hypothetical protein